MGYTHMITAPKSCSDINEIMEALGIYYNNKPNFISSKKFKADLSAIIGIKTNESQYTNRSQPLAELRFIEDDVDGGSNPDRRITKLGESLYEAHLKGDVDKRRDIWLSAINSVITGHHNPGNPFSSTPVERLGVMINAAKDLNGITNYEYAYIIQGMCNSYNMNRVNKTAVLNSYKEMVANIQKKRAAGVDISDDDIFQDYKKFIDDKDVDLLVSVGVLEEN